jgi:hypothetical protein
MANTNKPSGLSPVQYLNGAPWNGQARVYSIAYDYATAIYNGDPVILSGTSDGNGVAGITLATAGTGNPVVGAVVGIGRYESLIANPNNLSQTYFPAGGDGNTSPWYALVVDDPNVIFEAQDIGTSTALAAADIGTNINLKSGTGNGYISGWGIDNGSKGAGATIQCKLLGLVRTSDNAFGQYAKFLVKINNHAYGTGTGQAGF